MCACVYGTEHIIYTHIHKYTHECISMHLAFSWHNKHQGKNKQTMCVCVYVYTYTHIHLCMCTYLTVSWNSKYQETNPDSQTNSHIFLLVSCFLYPASYTWDQPLKFRLIILFVQVAYNSGCPESESHKLVVFKQNLLHKNDIFLMNCSASVPQRLPVRARLWLGSECTCLTILFWGGIERSVLLFEVRIQPTGLFYFLTATQTCSLEFFCVMWITRYEYYQMRACMYYCKWESRVRYRIYARMCACIHVVEIMCTVCTCMHTCSESCVRYARACMTFTVTISPVSQNMYAYIYLHDHMHRSNFWTWFVVICWSNV
jgi:hypothetical protein